jgi:hypothetical protein
MNVATTPGAVAGAGRLHARRCARHPAREAAARCPGCGEFFCRECVVEHAGRLLCANCLARSEANSGRRQRRFAAVGRALAAAVGALALWVAFYCAGAVLLKLPPDFHEGTVWKPLVERDRR